MRITLFLLLGAIVNVAVAWRYCARWGFPEKPLTSTSLAQQSTESAVVFGVTLREQNLHTGSCESGTWSVHQEMQAGLPFRSIGGARIEQGGIIVERDSQWKGSLPLLGRRSLLLRPLWPGFAINTVLSAAILWLLFVAPFAFRRRRRSKRGLCPTCAYDLRNRPGRFIRMP